LTINGYTTDDEVQADLGKSFKDLFHEWPPNLDCLLKPGLYGSLEMMRNFEWFQKFIVGGKVDVKASFYTF
jgi:hypothetical protein